MQLRDLTTKKRDGLALSDEEIRWFLGAYTRGELLDYHAAGLLGTIFVRGLDERELATWTRAMLDSGTRLDLSHVEKPKVDKHSTGGVGDKVSLPLAPALAACGVAVPMISGRGLGHTGGTLDKLEAIPGFVTRLSEDEIARVLDQCGLVFAGQTEHLVPADKKLYALRDATGLVEAVPLIASSIMSKKLAEDLDALVLDVKHGSGAFLPDPADGERLARTMLGIARSCGLRCSVVLTAMDRPLGRAVGHALEVVEAIECLSGGGPPDLRELVLVQGGELLHLAGVAASPDEGRARIARVLDDGHARTVLEVAIKAQGGDPRVVSKPELLPSAPAVEPHRASSSGYLSFADTRAVGLAAAALGGGRLRIDDAIDPAVGLVWRRVAGDEVRAGETLCEIHHRHGKGLAECQALLTSATVLAPAPATAPLVRGWLR
ncbi:MAG: hypothetical protein RIR65_708 [Planctomycetota bacterium]